MQNEQEKQGETLIETPQVTELVELYEASILKELTDEELELIVGGVAESM